MWARSGINILGFWWRCKPKIELQIINYKLGKGV